MDAHRKQNRHPLVRHRFMHLICAAFLVSVTGCGHWPPVVETAADIQALPVTEPSVRARGLHDADIPSLDRLHELRHLDFWGGYAVKDAAITDSGLADLTNLDLPKLDTLLLGACDKITDAGLVHLGKMNTIRTLSLAACEHITDAGLSPLLDMKNLVTLDLRGCPGITDVGLTTLAKKTDWQEISLGGCANVTADAVAKLQRALPNATIKKDDKEWGYHKRK